MLFCRNAEKSYWLMIFIILFLFFPGLNVYLMVVCVLLFIVIAATFTCFSLNDDIEKQLHRSIFGAMKQYKHNQKIKTRIDIMQQTYHCCGGISSRDWSSISWISNSFLDISHRMVKKSV